MKWFWVWIVAATALGGASRVRADTWIPIGSAVGLVAKYDVSDISPGDGRMFVTVDFEYSSDQTDPETKRSFRLDFRRFAIDCAAKTIAVTQVTLEDPSGRPVRHEEIGLQAVRFESASSPGLASLITIVCASPEIVGLTPSVRVGPSSVIQWRPAGRDDANASYSIDDRDVVDLKGGQIKDILVRALSDPPQDVGDGFYSATSIAEMLFDCDAATVTAVAYDDYDTDGRFIRSSRDDAGHPDVRDIAPGSVVAHLRDMICHRSDTPQASLGQTTNSQNALA